MSSFQFDNSKKLLTEAHNFLILMCEEFSAQAGRGRFVDGEGRRVYNGRQKGRDTHEDH